MSHVKVGPRHQITIPKPVFDELDLEVGDILEVAVENGKAIITPKRVVAKAPAVKLTAEEQQLLTSAQNKINAIQKDLATAKGLTENELSVAEKVGLIESGQRWWWSESWQKQEREAQKDIDSGNIETFDSPDDFIKSLQS